LLQLTKYCKDPKLKSEAMCLTSYEIENFEFSLGMNICYDISFVDNFVSKILRSKEMHIDVAIDNLKYLIAYLKNYRKNGFTLTWDSTQKISH